MKENTITATSGSLPKRLKIGSTLVLLAGLVPFLVASVFFVAFVVSVRNPSEPWLSGQFPSGPASYTLDEIRAFIRRWALTSSPRSTFSSPTSSPAASSSWCCRSSACGGG